MDPNIIMVDQLMRTAVSVGVSALVAGGVFALYALAVVVIHRWMSR